LFIYIEITPAVLNILILKEHIEIVCLGRGPPLTLGHIHIMEFGILIFSNLGSQMVADQ